MIITLKGADFSKNNIGTLSTWRIIKNLKNVTTSNTVTSIDKGAADKSYTATFTINSEYTFSSATVTMGGEDITSSLVWNTDKTSATLTIAEVTGNVIISIIATSTSTGGGGEGGGESGVTTWYINHLNNSAKFTNNTNVAGRGWTLLATNAAYQQIIGKPINTMHLFTNKASQEIVIMKLASKGATTGEIVDTITLTKDSAGNFAIGRFNEVTLQAGEYLAFGCSDNADVHFFYATGAVTDANGVVDKGFHSRVPKVYGSGTAWTEYAQGSLGWSLGYTN